MTCETLKHTKKSKKKTAGKKLLKTNDCKEKNQWRENYETSHLVDTREVP